MELKREQVATQGVVFGLSALTQEYNITWACPEGLNHFNPNCDQSQISTQFPNKKQKNTVYHENLLLKRFQLNRHTIGFHLQTQKLEPPYKSPSFTHGLEWKEPGVYVRKHAPAQSSFIPGWFFGFIPCLHNDWVISYLRWGFQPSISTPIMSHFGSKTI